MTESKRHSPYQVGPEADRLAGLSREGERRWIDPTVVRGRWWRVRVGVGSGLVALFVGLPHLTIAGKPAVLLDLSQRQFTFVGVTLHPTDNLLLLVFGIGVIITLLLCTSVLGRVWCGYACPQTVYLELVFRPLESLIEGAAAMRRKRDAGPWTADRAIRKGIKWGVYLVIGLILAHTFVAYFAGADAVWAQLGSLPGAPGSLAAPVGVVAAMMFVDFAIFREQMCTTACPYGRLQTVLYDADTSIVGYDEKRGEPRGKVKKGRDAEPRGDCIDCGRCVRCCPTGIDIRDGLQMECVGCAQCVDACDGMMTRIGKPTGLVRYTSLRALTTGGRWRLWRPRVFVYLTILLVAYSAFWGLLLTRSSASAELLRGSRDPYRTLPSGQVANQLRVRFTNHRPEPQAFRVELLEPATGKLVVTQVPFDVEGHAVATLDIVAMVPRTTFQKGTAPARFRFTSDTGTDLEQAFVLLGPYGR